MRLEVRRVRTAARGLGRTGRRSDCANQENCHLWPQVASEEEENVKTTLHSDKPRLAVGQALGSGEILRDAEELS